MRRHLDAKLLHALVDDRVPDRRAAAQQPVADGDQIEHIRRDPRRHPFRRQRQLPIRLLRTSIRQRLVCRGSRRPVNRTSRAHPPARPPRSSTESPAPPPPRSAHGSFVAPATTRNASTTIVHCNSSHSPPLALSICTSNFRIPNTRALKFTINFPVETFQSSTPSPCTSATTTPCRHHQLRHINPRLLHGQRQRMRHQHPRLLHAHRHPVRRAHHRLQPLHPQRQRERPRIKLIRRQRPRPARSTAATRSSVLASPTHLPPPP